MPTPQITQTPAASPALFGVGAQKEGAVIQSNAAYLANRYGGIRLANGGPRISADTPTTLQAGVEPLLSLALIELGTPQHARFPGSLIAPDILKSRWIMNYWTWTGAPQLQLGEEGLERAFRADRRRTSFTGSVTTTSMTRRGIETPLDVDEIRVAESQLAVSVHATALSRDMVMLAEEREKQQLFGVASSYPAGHALDATGSEWNKAATGDSKADITTAVDKLVAQNPPYQREDITVVMTYGARDAAFGDPTFAALANGPISRGQFPTEQDLATYWGIGRVEIADAVYDPGTGVITSMWGDVAVVFVDTTRASTPVSREFGQQTFGVTFRFSGSGVSAPYLENRSTSIIYPFDSYSLAAMIQGKAGYLIHNVKVST